MIKKYVIGSLKNPKGAIKALEELGGINRYHKSGDLPAAIYFIDGDNYIDCEEKDTLLANIIMECFEEIQPIPPIEPEPKVITNLDMTRWYFEMMRYGRAVQVRYSVDGPIFSRLWDYESDDDETEVIEVRIDFEEWIPIEEVGIK